MILNSIMFAFIDKLRENYRVLSSKQEYSSTISDRGQISGTTIILSGLAIVTLTIAAWIGNAAAGSGADTANCITSFQEDRGKYGEQDSCWSSDSHAKTANDSRESASGFTGGFGSFGSSTAGGDRANVVNTSKSIQAIERMLLKESGTMNQVYTNSLPILNSTTCQTANSNTTFYSSCFSPINRVIDNSWIHERRNSLRAGDYDDVVKFLEESNSSYKDEAKALANRYKVAASAMEKLNWDNDATWRGSNERSVATNRAMLTAEVARLENIQREWIAINQSANALLSKLK